MLDRNGRVIGILTVGYSGNGRLELRRRRSITRATSSRAARPISASAKRAWQDRVTGSGGQTESDRRQQQGEQEFLRAWARPSRRRPRSTRRGSAFAAAATRPDSRLVRSRMVCRVYAGRHARRRGRGLRRLFPVDEDRDEQVPRLHAHRRSGCATRECACQAPSATRCERSGCSRLGRADGRFSVVDLIQDIELHGTC